MNKLLSEVLTELEVLKTQFLDITGKYGSLEDGDGNSVYFGSEMWLDYFSDYSLEELECLSAVPPFHSKPKILADYSCTQEIVKKLNKLFKENNLSQFLLEESPLYWLGALPEPYTSMY